MELYNPRNRQFRGLWLIQLSHLTHSQTISSKQAYKNCIRESKDRKTCTQVQWTNINMCVHWKGSNEHSVNLWFRESSQGLDLD